MHHKLGELFLFWFLVTSCAHVAIEGRESYVLYCHTASLYKATRVCVIRCRRALKENMNIAYRIFMQRHIA